MERLARLTDELNQLIGAVTTKNLFAGYGIFKQKKMFGLYLNHILYIKAKKELAEYILKLGGVPCNVVLKSNYVGMNDYYSLPKEVRENKTLYRQLLYLSVKQVRERCLEDELIKKNRLKEMSNFTIKHERLLERIGILDVKSFKKEGAVKSYVALKKLGHAVNLNIFWAFVGALNNTHAYVLSKELRLEALLALNKELDKANLKREKCLLLDDYQQGKIKRNPLYFGKI